MSAARTNVRRRRRTPSGVRLSAGQVGELCFLLPILLVMTLAVLLPTVNVIAHAFTNWQPGFESPWVGLDNFRTLFESRSFRQILANQAFLLIGVPLWVILPLAIAFLLYKGIPGTGTFRAIYFFPAVASPALIGILFAMLFKPGGLINATLRDVGLGALASDWLTSEHLVKPVLIFVLAWATMGMGVVIFSAALSAVPPELFESAEIDGASWWQRLWHVALPSIRRTVELWAVILVITVFTGIFPWIYTLTRGGPGYSSTTLDWDLYQNALQYGYFGLAAAESVVLLVIVMLVIGLGALLTRGKRV